MPLSRTVVLGNHERMLQCVECGTITRWSLSAVHDLEVHEAIDLREDLDLRDENVIELDLEIEGETPRSNGRRR